MTKDSLIFVPRLVSAANFTAYSNAGSDTSFTGELIGIKIGVINNAGSLTLVEEHPFGNIDIGVIATASGTAQVGQIFPVRSRTTTSNAALWSGGNIYTPYIVTAPIFVAGSGYTSGTTNFVSGIELIIVR